MGSPRGFVVPALTVVGTVAAIAVYKYGPQQIASAASLMYKPHHTQSSRKSQFNNLNKKSSKIPKNHQSNTNTNELTKDNESTSSPNTTNDEASKKTLSLPKSSLFMAMMLQDTYLLFAMFGVCVMALAVLVSLAVIAVDEELTSPNQLLMFSPLMWTALGMIAIGVLHTLLLPSRGNPHPHEANIVHANSVVSTVESTTSSNNVNRSFNEINEEPRKKKCPFGFG